MFEQVINGCDLTPAIQKDDELTADQYSWPMFKDQKYDRYLRHFMFSFKNIYSENINCSNLMFVTGPTKSGKSWLLR